ncbi:MAG TPA: diaminopimelate epimerase [Gemmatimonadetes bacterium]|jgi:diaminopimelate epimerase|nr:diaminopimelate epimerase [Gemmatimonadota bacterium]
MEVISDFIPNEANRCPVSSDEYNLRVRNRFYKGHGLGNDYLIFEKGEDCIVDGTAITKICDRWKGVGADGVVLLIDRDGPPFQLRMFNPDGSEFERSGNGLRILGSYLAGEGLVDKDPFEVSVGGDVISLEVMRQDSLGNYDVKVNMGTANLGNDAVHFDSRGLDDDGRLKLGDYGCFELNLVSMGNPHCVVFPNNWNPNLLEQIGPLLCEHESFRSGTNVQLARFVAEGVIEVLIWERGVGVTSASGTSACAVAVAAVQSSRANPGEFQIQMQGGSLQVSVDAEFGVTLRGPVQEVFQGRLTQGFLASIS